MNYQNLSEPSGRKKADNWMKLLNSLETSSTPSWLNHTNNGIETKNYDNQPKPNIIVLVRQSSQIWKDNSETCKFKKTLPKTKPWEWLQKPLHYQKMYKAYASNDPSTCKQSQTTFTEKLSYRKEEFIQKENTKHQLMQYEALSQEGSSKAKPNRTTGKQWLIQILKSHRRHIRRPYKRAKKNSQLNE